MSAPSSSTQAWQGRRKRYDQRCRPIFCARLSLSLSLSLSLFFLSLSFSLSLSLSVCEYERERVRYCYKWESIAMTSFSSYLGENILLNSPTYIITTSNIALFKYYVSREGENYFINSPTYIITTSNIALFKYYVSLERVKTIL